VVPVAAAVVARVRPAAAAVVPAAAAAGRAGLVPPATEVVADARS
jgi:hypothetical protein